MKKFEIDVDINSINELKVSIVTFNLIGGTLF